MELLFSFLAGVIVGLAVAVVVYSWRTARGILKIDHSNLERDLYRFEIDKIDDLDKKNKIICRIDHHADLSQK